MDYRELLKKYMKHVLEEEGTVYIGPADFLPDELAELEAILGELEDEEESE